MAKITTRVLVLHAGCGWLAQATGRFQPFSLLVAEAIGAGVVIYIETP